MKAFVSQSSPDTPLGSEQRNLLSVAYKNVVGARRTAFRVLNSLERTNDSSITADYKGVVKKELREQCMEIIVSYYI